MKGFFKYVFASMLGFIFGYIIIFFLSIFMVFGVISFMANRTMNKFEDKVELEENTILKITLNQPIMERVDEFPFDLSFLDEDFVVPMSLKDVLDEIDKAKNDSRIEGIYLNLTLPAISYATLEEIRNALIDFKKSGKFIYSYSEIMTESAYYLASVADKIYLQPEGMFMFDGFLMETAYIRGTLDKLDIQPKVIRVGEYKSAGENVERYDMSPAERKQLEAFLFPLYSSFLKKIAESRELDYKQLELIADSLLIRKAEDAVRYKLVDELIYKDQLIDLLKKELETDDLNVITLAKYRHALDNDDGDKSYTKDRIAVIYADGAIYSGKGSTNMVGSETLSKAIRKARQNDKVKAIVLRVNSPGGSSLASDVIWREAKLAAEAKPFVVSMGDVAASGGYYIACMADTIVAQPNTITGSIGVIGIFMQMEDFWKNKVGVTFDRVKTGAYSDLMNPNRDMTPEEEVIIEQYVEDIYTSFITKVAEGRNMSLDLVDSLGRGRIWSGTQAKERGLVDVLGGFYDAIEIAAGMAGLENYRLKTYPEIDNPFDKFINSFSSAKIRNMIMKSVLDEDYHIYKRADELKDMNGAYMLMPYEFRIH